MKKIHILFLIFLLSFITACNNNSSDNTSPIADAGADQEVTSEDTLVLYGSGSDTDGTIVGYEWVQLEGPSAILVGTDSTTLTVTCPVVSSITHLTFQLTVTDDDGATGIDEVVVTVLPDTLAPNPAAKAGPDRTGSTTGDMANVRTQEIVFLDASSSIGIEYKWAIQQAPVNASTEFTSDYTPITGFFGDTAGEYTVELTVGNGQGLEDTDTVVVTLLDDMDGDGLADIDDLDRDGDGFLNTIDAFPDDRASHLDSDGDGIGNYYTVDVDADGTSDVDDAFPLDPNLTDYEIYTELKESTISNQNDGISLAENVDSLLDVIEGTIYSIDGGPDLDYFATDWPVGRYSLLLEGSDQAMQPNITVVDRNGVRVSSIEPVYPIENESTALAVQIPVSGRYFTIVTDVSGNSDPTWGYRLKVISDQDMDGVADGLEQALDLNHNTIDSDGDSIVDFVEVGHTLTDWNNYRDIDGDGLPAWWDIDTDGDSIPDVVEYYIEVDEPGLDEAELAAKNDADADGIQNYMDTDSDANIYALDILEVGLNPWKPIDTDGDSIPDYLDKDNDGDGLPDINEALNTYNVPVTFSINEDVLTADTLRLMEFKNETADVNGVCRAGDAILITGGGLPVDSSTSWAVFNTLSGSLNVRPESIDSSGLHLTCPDGIDSGLLEFYVITDNMRSGGLQVIYLAADTPILSGYESDVTSASATLTGLNLDASLTVNFTGASLAIDNTGGDPNLIEIPIP
ncbi:MAG: hypothetical protein QNJ78_15485, partial [Gammaproteobacteria bacterium]|nr:hypothetical protein [Gammaproteobacteria bacterium]